MAFRLQLIIFIETVRSGWRELFKAGLAIIVIALLAQQLSAPAAQAQSKLASKLVSKPTLVSATELTSTTVQFKLGKKMEQHDIVCFGSTPGTAKNRSNGVLFTPFSHTLKTLKNKGKAKKIRLDRAKALLKNGKVSCATLDISPTPSPDPEPTPAPTQPTPTPTPTPAPANFLANGDVTSAGKTLFGIPQNLAANKNTGQTILQNQCLGCHSENGLSSSFPDLRMRTAEPPMAFTQVTLPDENLAHLVAWLNRFNP